MKIDVMQTLGTKTMEHMYKYICVLDLTRIPPRIIL